MYDIICSLTVIETKMPAKKLIEQAERATLIVGDFATEFLE